MENERTATPSVADVQPSATRGLASFAQVQVFEDATSLLDDWAILERDAPCSVYQTRAWLLPWAETIGRQAEVTPLFAVARDDDGRVVMLLCLGIARMGPLRVAHWLGGRESNAAMPLARPDVVWSRREILRLLREIARLAGGLDTFLLTNQPYLWDGVANPFSHLRHQDSPSASHATTLPPKAESLFVAKLSKDARKKLRKKEARLATLGPVRHLVATTALERSVVTGALLSLRSKRFRTLGIRPQTDATTLRAFIDALARSDGQALELHALLVGERVVAVYGGGAHRGQWSGMVSAFDMDETIAKSSPGDLLLMRIVAHACSRGLRRFDLGIGEARYKAALCDEPIMLFDCFAPMTVAGHVLGMAVATRQMVKRAIKRNTRLSHLAMRLRRLRGRGL